MYAGSAHFKPDEFRCPHCGEVKLERSLCDHLEALRSLIRRPLPIVSGYRCPTHNARVGGAPRSQHLLGRAADIPPGLVSERQARQVGFTGIGINAARWVVHVDVRAGPLTTWRY